MSTGNQVSKIRLITSPNILLLPIIAIFDKRTCTNHTTKSEANATERIEGVLKPQQPDPEQPEYEYAFVSSTPDTDFLSTHSEQGSDLTAFNAYPYVPYTNSYGTMQARQNATIPFYDNHNSANSNGFPYDVTYSVDEKAK